MFVRKCVVQLVVMRMLIRRAIVGSYCCGSVTSAVNRFNSNWVIGILNPPCASTHGGSFAWPITLLSSPGPPCWPRCHHQPQARARQPRIYPTFVQCSFVCFDVLWFFDKTFQAPNWPPSCNSTGHGARSMPSVMGKYSYSYRAVC